MRAGLLAMLAVVACSGLRLASASSADWSAPEALWSSDLSTSELEARHSEFLMDVGGSSSSSSSSTGSAVNLLYPSPVTATFNCQATNATAPNFCTFTAKDVVNTVATSFGFPNATLVGEGFNATLGAGSAGSRRLLQTSSSADGTFSFTGSPIDGGMHAATVYAAFVASLKCTTDACRSGVSKQFNLPEDLGNSATFAAVASTINVNSIGADAAVVAAGGGNINNNLASNDFATVGGPRKTNIGYYVLGAVALAFAVAALIYFIVHRRPVVASPREEVSLAPVVAAPVAASGVVVAEEPVPAAAAAGGQGQMDYRSVFALKHNVLDKSAEQKAAEEDEHNHNDVHFILHQ